jgi:hypothetical protein
MKKWVKGMTISGITLVLLLSTVTVFAATVTRNIRVTYRNISLVVDGEDVTLQNIAGDSVEPFIFEGMVFVPVCALGEALGLDVNWDGRTSTVTVTSPDAATNISWLDHMPHLNYQSGSRHSLTSWGSGHTSTNGTAFERGLRFSFDYWGGTPRQSFDVALNGNYDKFIGTLVSTRHPSHAASGQVRFYGDGHLLYTSPIISSGTIPIPFNIDVSGVLIMHVHVELTSSTHFGMGIVDARFEQY